MPIDKIVSLKNERAWVSMVSYLKKINIKISKRKKDSGSHLGNPANFHPNWAGLAVLFSRQILNGSQDFFLSLTF